MKISKFQLKGARAAANVDGPSLCCENVTTYDLFMAAFCKL